MEVGARHVVPLLRDRTSGVDGAGRTAHAQGAARQRLGKGAPFWPFALPECVALVPRQGIKETADWTEAIWPSQAGGHQVYAHAVRTWVRKLGPTLVLLTRQSLSQPLDQARYWGSTLLNADAQRVVHILAVRWDMETLFEDYKDLLGSDHYQVMSATAIVRFWTLVSCLAYFLDKQRATLQAERPGEHVTWGDVR